MDMNVCLMESSATQMAEMKKRHKTEIAMLKADSNCNSKSQLNKLKQRQQNERSRLKIESKWNQQCHKRQRQDEEWIPLGGQVQVREQVRMTDRSNGDVLPAPRENNPFRSIENNIRFQGHREQVKEATLKIKKIIKNGNSGLSQSSSKNVSSSVNSLAKAKLLKAQQMKRKAEDQDIEN